MFQIKSIAISVAFFLVVFVTTREPAQALILYGNDAATGGSTMWLLDINTGISSVFTDTPGTRIGSIAVDDANSTIYWSDRSGPLFNTNYDGTTVFIGNMGSSLGDGGLAYDAVNNILYATNNSASITNLYTVNTKSNSERYCSPTLHLKK